MLALGLWLVGFVLFINGMWLLGKMDNKAVIPMNIFVFVIQLAGVLRIVFTADDIANYYGAALTLLFTFTYGYVAATQIWNLDVRGLGWYCLPVAVSAVPDGIQSLQAGGQSGLAILWFMWATLWFMYWLLLALDRSRIAKITAWWTVINAIVTFVGAYLTATEYMPWW